MREKATTRKAFHIEHAAIHGDLMVRTAIKT
jgi:hypothetical protein